MKIEIAKQDLETTLAVAGLATGSASDLSSHYLFRIKDGKAQVLSFEQRLFAFAPLACTFEGEEGDAFTVEASRLDKWMGGVSDGVLTLSSDGDGTVTAKGSRSKVRFRSLDPSKFPFWDSLFESRKSVGAIAPDSLARALSVSRWFMSTDDTSKPELCQIEAVEGVLWATDRRALSSVEVPSLPSLSIRIPGKDVSTIVRFLSNKQTTGSLVDLSESERSSEDGGGSCAILVRGDGAYLGITRPGVEFPTLNVDRESEPPAKIFMDRNEFGAALAVLSASAPKGHESVTFHFDQEEGALSVAMPCDAGGTNTYPLMLARVEGGENLDADFTVDHPYITGIGATFKLETLEFGVFKRGRGGYISFASEDEDESGNGNRYFSVVVWRT
jgi:hypothetical protein